MLRNPITITPSQLWIAITAGAAVIAAAVAITWEVRKDVIDDLKRQVESYEKSSTWKLPETIHKIGQASDALTLKLAERAELQKLRLDTQELLANSAKSEQTIKNQTETLRELQATLSGIVKKSDRVEIEAGESIALVENSVFLGLKTIYSGSVSLRLDEQDRVIDVGESIVYSFGSQKCRVTLTRIQALAPKKAQFSYGCA